jgi:hypothetical protein
VIEGEPQPTRVDPVTVARSASSDGKTTTGAVRMQAPSCENRPAAEGHLWCPRAGASPRGPGAETNWVRLHVTSASGPRIAYKPTMTLSA